MTPMALVPAFALRFVDPARYRRLRMILSAAEVAQMSAVTVFTAALLVAAVATGRLAEWVLLWFAPTRLGILTPTSSSSGCRIIRSTARSAI